VCSNYNNYRGAKFYNHNDNRIDHNDNRINYNNYDYDYDYDNTAATTPTTATAPIRVFLFWLRFCSALAACSAAYCSATSRAFRALSRARFAEAAFARTRARTRRQSRSPWRRQRL
jgi:hypothetical protein